MIKTQKDLEYTFLSKVLLGLYSLRLGKSGVNVVFYSVTVTDQLSFSF